ncbi:MAG: GreA/GreB family elongation factor [bacterium]|jgi:regulator of nucleoside diphosphate kinase
MTAKTKQKTTSSQRKDTCVFSSQDHTRLRNYLHGYSFSHAGSVFTGESVSLLNKKMSQAKIVDPEKVPRDVVTMYSTVVISEQNTETLTSYTIVYPGETDIDKNRISVLSPIGSSLIGHRVGDVVDIQLPYGPKRYTIRELLYQPEAAGEFHTEQ